LGVGIWGLDERPGSHAPKTIDQPQLPAPSPSYINWRKPIKSASCVPAAIASL
jgi:hypothetical protein